MEFRVSEINEFKGGVYKISSKIDNRVYYGSAEIFRRRFYDHSNTMKRGCHKNPPLQNFYKKYGKSCLTFEVVEIVENPFDKISLLKTEQKYLDLVFSSKTERPFNILKIAGNSSGRKVSEDQKNRARERMKGKPLCKEAYIWDEKKRRRHSERMKGRYVGKKSPLYGKKLDQELCQKMSESRTIGFLQYDLSGKFIKRHNSAKLLEREFNTPRESFNKASNGRLQTLKGFIWKYDNGDILDQLPKEFMDTIVLKPQKRIFAYSYEGELIAEFKSALDLQNRTGYDRKHIKKVCRREDNRFKGLFWTLEP